MLFVLVKKVVVIMAAPNLQWSSKKTLNKGHNHHLGCKYSSSTIYDSRHAKRDEILISVVFQFESYLSTVLYVTENIS